MNRVVHIGIDAGNFPVLDGMASGGLMPAYAALKERSGHGILRSTTPWFTVPGWVSLMTGVRAERHGLIHWTTVRPRDHWVRERGGRLVSSRDIPFPTMFEEASAAGLRVASLNMPVTFPPFPVNGVLVSGFLGPTDHDRVAYPQGFLRRYPSYGVDVETGPAAADAAGDGVLERYARRLSQMAAERARVAVDLIREGHHLVSVVFVGPDRLLHVGWPAVAAALAGDRDGDAGLVADYYGALDAALARLVDAAGDRLVLLTSDHGQGPPPERVLAINAWLRDGGWLAGRHETAHRLARFVPSWPKRMLWEAFSRIRRRPMHAAPFIDWDRTVAYGIAFPHCGLVGVALREPSEALFTEIADAARTLRDPDTGRPLVTEVLRGDQVAAEHGLETYPDLLAVLDRGVEAIPKVDDRPWLRTNEHPENGSHTPDGLLLASGPGIEPGQRGEQAIWEVAPTVLAALGVDVPRHADGEPIPWIVSGGRRAGDREDRGPRDPEGGLSEREEEEVARHLRELGYLE